MKYRSFHLGWIFVLFLFLLAFLPRALQPVSRPLVWYLRSAHFVEAVLAGDWANTVYSEHPGVGLMWPVGIVLKIYWALSGIVPAAHTVPPDFEPIHFFGPVPIAEIAAGVTALAFLIALGIAGIYLLLRKLFDGAAAAVAGVILALSPYYLTQSKVLHLDAWMATLMLLSALALLVYRRERRARWLIFSAALGGLALLVKTAALFLLPFAALVLLVDAISGPRPAIRTVLSSTTLPFLAWALVAAVIYFALWPAMWVEPGSGLAAVAWGLAHHAGTAHDTPTFFLNQVTFQDPGPIFYAAALWFRAGEVELAFVGVAAILGAAHLLRCRRLSQNGIDYLLLLAYAIFFLAQMSLAAKKMPRYVLPALLALDVLAAAGIAVWARRLAGGRPKLAPLLMVIPLLLQAALILPHHPAYGTAFNWLAGGPPAAARTILIGEEGEGLADLAATLNSHPDSADLTVAAQLLHVFNQTFRGTTVDIDQPADYLIFHRNYIVRDYKVEQWGSLWERYAARAPEREVAFGGVPYAWLYPAASPATPPEHSLPSELGARYRFLGYDLRSTQAAPGDRIPLVLYWQAIEPAEEDLSIFLHLLGPAGELIWQDDGAAAHGARSPWSWAAGETIVDPHTIPLPPDLPAGDYLLVTGLYDWRTGERLPVTGTAAGQDWLTIAAFSVRRPATPVAAWIARGVAALLLLSALAAIWRPGGRL
ncbi:MAG: glycosyltransferase family 39 protein [Anaerolineae bacterium]|nr:glycosyltransferase family 39 protein [Anaerolineae bacterium]